MVYEKGNVPGVPGDWGMSYVGASCEGKETKISAEAMEDLLCNRKTDEYYE